MPLLHSRGSVLEPQDVTLTLVYSRLPEPHRTLTFGTVIALASGCILLLVGAVTG